MHDPMHDGNFMSRITWQVSTSAAVLANGRPLPKIKYNHSLVCMVSIDQLQWLPAKTVDARTNAGHDKFGDE